ncbi:hypothetical protein M885DRAFT_166046 [Pelagophyceae sp. CCMP2097]|nr:hypothetical protein M885DRAFT_166046 [Pelagophyceae sp. CCMP2097]
MGAPQVPPLREGRRQPRLREDQTWPLPANRRRRRARDVEARRGQGRALPAAPRPGEQVGALPGPRGPPSAPRRARELRGARRRDPRPATRDPPSAGGCPESLDGGGTVDVSQGPAPPQRHHHHCEVDVRQGHQGARRAQTPRQPPGQIESTKYLPSPSSPVFSSPLRSTGGRAGAAAATSYGAKVAVRSASHHVRRTRDANLIVGRASKPRARLRSARSTQRRRASPSAPNLDRRDRRGCDQTTTMQTLHIFPTTLPRRPLPRRHR